MGSDCLWCLCRVSSVGTNMAVSQQLNLCSFKRRLGWRREAGEFDGIEQFNFYRREFEDDNRVPECIMPFMDEIRAFTEVRYP